MKSFDQIDPFKTGLVGLILTAAVVVTAQNYDKVPLVAATREYSGYFADTGGLNAGSPVQVAGVKVGRVARINIEGDKIRIDFTAEGIKVGDDSTLAIKTETVLGSKYLQLDPVGDELVERNDVIPLERTSTPYSLTDALGDLTTAVSDLDTQQVVSALETLGDTLDQTEPNLAAALDGVTRFSQTIASRDEMIQDLLGNAEAVTGVLSHRTDQLNKLVLDANVLFAALDGRRQAVDTLLVNLSAVTSQVQALIDENQAQLEPSLDQLNQVVEMLDRHKQDLQASLKPLQQYATSLGESVASGPFFSAYVMNLLPGQLLQPFIDAAFRDQGLDPNILGGPTWPVTCGDNTPPGTVPHGGTTPVPNPSNCPIQPGQVPGNPVPNQGVPTAPAQNPLFPGLPSIPGIPGLGGR